MRNVNAVTIARCHGVHLLDIRCIEKLSRSGCRSQERFVHQSQYSSLVWATLLAFTEFGDFPKGAVWVGVAIIVGAGLYTVHRESSATGGTK